MHTFCKRTTCPLRLWLGTLDVYRSAKFRFAFLTSAALQVWSYYPALFQSVYPTLPRRLAPLLPFGWANRTLLITLRVAFCGSGGIRTLAHSTVTFLLLLRMWGRTFNSNSTIRLQAFTAKFVGVGGIEPPLRPNLTMLVAPVYQSFTPCQCL